MTQETACWQPDPNSLERSHMSAFLQRSPLQGEGGYPELYEWSLREPAAFWSLLADYAAVEFIRPPEQVFRQPGDMLSAKWFEGATLNFAANLLVDADDRTALIFRDESGRRIELSRADLCSRAAACAAGMRAAGVSPGDRVAAVLPNCPETVVIMLAAASVGAVFSSCSPDFGTRAVVERFGQIEPRLLFVCNGYNYAGKPMDCREKLTELQTTLAGVEQFIVVSFRDDISISGDVADAVSFETFCVDGAAPEYAELPFDHPLYVLYSSGTTGKPKCIVHGAGGTLLQHKKELLLHTDLHDGDRVFYFTTCGWMMWNWLVSALATGAAVVLYDGSPFHPAADSLLQMAADERVTVFGTSPRYLTALEKSPQRAAHYKLPALTKVLSTGAPLSVDSYRFVAGLLGEHVQLCSISGGTDLVSCFALGNPLLPVYPGEIQCRGLGMAVEVFDAAGQSVTGITGELVCTQAFPSMPLGFWNDPDGDIYRRAYFERHPGVWTHGDQALLTGRGGLVISGRSDAVLNPGGVRIGSAEVCDPVLLLPEILDAIAVGHRSGGEEEVILFVVLAAETQLSPPFEDRIRKAVRAAASPRHVPARIFAVPEIPRTLSGKPVELAVRAVLHGETVDNLDALANPAALEHFRNRI